MSVRPAPDAPPNGTAASDRTTEALERLHLRLDAIERRLDRLTPLLDALGSAPATIAAAVDVADERVRALQERGVDPAERLTAVAALVERLTDPDLLRGLHALLDVLPQLPGLASMAVDTADAYAAQLYEEGIDPVHGLAQGARLALLFGGLIGEREVHALRTLLASPVLDPEAVRVVSELAGALDEAAQAKPARVGPLGLLRALRDPDLRRALGFLTEVGRRLGRRLDSSAPIR